MKIYILYQPPIEKKSRTGHVAVIAMDENRETFYDSMYTGVKTSVVKKKSTFKKLFTTVPTYHITSYENDCLMRGKYLMVGNKEGSIPNLIKSLPTDHKMRQQYFKAGNYPYAFELPSTIDPEKLITELTRIRTTGEWAVFGKLTHYLALNPNAYNCSSAIEKALDKASPHPDSSLAFVKKSARVLYFFWFIFLSTLEMSANNNPLTILACIPAFFWLAQSCGNASDYVKDIKTLAIEKPSLPLLFFINAFAFTFNILLTAITKNACAVFAYPRRLARILEEKECIRWNTGTMHLPELAEVSANRTSMPS